jgi:HEPN domain-containing protein
MGRRRYPPTDPREWLNRAKSNLAGAGQATPGVYLEDLCFDAQQAAEKAIKAVFIHYGLHFPYVHDLRRLLQLLNQGGVKVPKYAWRAEVLTPFAFEARYPGHSLQSPSAAYRPQPNWKTGSITQYEAIARPSVLPSLTILLKKQDFPG